MPAPSDEVYQLSVQDDTTDRKLTLDLTRTGLTMHKLTIGSGRFPARDVLCGPESSSSFKIEGRKFMNQVVGRFTNRLPAGKSYIIDSSREEGGKRIAIDLDENEPFQDGRGNCLHSGQNGYDLREFEPVGADSKIVQEFRSTNTEPANSEPVSPPSLSSSSAHFHLHSPSGDQGFPEAIDILATVTLELFPVPKDTDLTIPSETGPKSRIGRASFSLRAKLSDPEEVARRDSGTPINLTWHTGYILNDFRGEPSDSNGIQQHKLWINSDHHLAVHQSQLPTGEIQPNKALGIDFSTPEAIRSIGEIMPPSGFDQCFIFKNTTGDEVNNTKNPKAILRSPKDDLILVFYSNQTAVQCYSANYFDGIGSRKELHRRTPGEQGAGGYKRQEAIYLEFQEPSSLCTNLNLQNNLKAWVDAGDHRLRKEENKSPTKITNTILYPNQVYSNWFFIDIFI
ncbi:hypothetical protein PGT21_001312 [Puccinia graminis f. sp. tritici]|uniref:Uncharacterized protein n=1 Tax=Puccinia graminis f. sp. tritici TaxID=56615 RepID=A0A5B0NMC3_PUCGR|nr:hypothetical protein PGT21_001312 [Puccinia graminis f. sp. tritici]KAA1127819.1 hypothetical protein PGTUg99_007588 [Puccinia graminis f. sp. tritici]